MNRIREIVLIIICKCFITWCCSKSFLKLMLKEQFTLKWKFSHFLFPLFLKLLYFLILLSNETCVSCWLPSVEHKISLFIEDCPSCCFHIIKVNGDSIVCASYGFIKLGIHHMTPSYGLLCYCGAYLKLDSLWSPILQIKSPTVLKRAMLIVFKTSCVFNR